MRFNMMKDMEEGDTQKTNQGSKAKVLIVMSNEQL